MFKRKGGGVKGLLNNDQNCTFLSCRLPLLALIVQSHTKTEVWIEKRIRIVWKGEINGDIHRQLEEYRTICIFVY